MLLPQPLHWWRGGPPLIQFPPRNDMQLICRRVLFHRLSEMLLIQYLYQRQCGSGTSRCNWQRNNLLQAKAAEIACASRRKEGSMQTTISGGVLYAHNAREMGWLGKEMMMLLKSGQRSLGLLGIHWTRQRKGGINWEKPKVKAFLAQEWDRYLEGSLHANLYITNIHLEISLAHFPLLGNEQY